MDAKDLRSLLQRVGVATLQNHVGDIVATLFYGTHFDVQHRTY